ncbi:hypothetical protein [Actinomadura gamaensis]|uniref:ATP-binding protein n=1 Tax=Actinomadura gamaensis TaxID=1763541 RepID=A0ABV9UFQ5_9ACTN
MDSDASRIAVTGGLEAVRRRPLLYYGVPLDDPGLPGVVLSLAVRDALTEEATDAPLRVRVVIEGPRRFSVEDNGPGIPLARSGPDGALVLTEPMTTLLCGRPAVYKTGMAVVTALCAEAVADVWHDGRHYRQRADWTAEPRPLETLEPSDRHGTRVTYRLRDAYLSPAAALPDRPDALLQQLFVPPPERPDIPRPGPETTIELIDRRDGTRTLLLP